MGDADNERIARIDGESNAIISRSLIGVGAHRLTEREREIMELFAVISILIRNIFPAEIYRDCAIISLPNNLVNDLIILHNWFWVGERTTRSKGV